MNPHWIVLLPLISAALSPLVVRCLGIKRAGWVLSLMPFAIAVSLVQSALGASQEVAVWEHAWLPSLGLDLALRVGGFERLFLLLVSFIGGLVCIYGGGYLDGDSKAPRFFVIVQVFMSAMLGVIAADDMILTFVFWELTSVTSFLLVGYKSYDPVARKAALQALLVTGLGGLALLAGFILLSDIAGVTRISELAAVRNNFADHPWTPAAVLLILLGCFTKSAQVPFHFWLPGAMSAPTPVSSYLHSATMVKAGVILLAKLSPALAQLPIWGWVVLPVGLLTMIVAAAMAVVQTDLKRLLAYSTVSILGCLVMLLGFGDSLSFKTAMFLILVHGFYKGSLFMVAGTVDHATSTRDVRSLSGLRASMPWLAFAAGAAALSMSGVPPTLGFISKELLYEAKLNLPIAHHLVTAIGVLANALMVAIALTVGIRPFLGSQGSAEVHHKPGLTLLLPPLMLAFLGLAFGFMPGWLDKFWISPAALAAGHDPKAAKLYLWHGFTPVLALSVLTLALGVVLFRSRRRLRQWAGRLAWVGKCSPTALYESLLQGILHLAQQTTSWIQNGQLRVYVRVTLAAATAMILIAVFLAYADFPVTSLSAPGVIESFVVLLMSVSCIAVVRAKSRLAAVLCMGGVGYSVAFLFVAYGAPDLAITQLLVETLTVVLFSFVILNLPQIRELRQRRHLDGAIAILAGLAMTVVVWKALHIQTHDPISPGLIERSYTEAYGRNVVNVILVDFRALDTMGEILVLALASLGVTALLVRRKRTAKPQA